MCGLYFVVGMLGFLFQFYADWTEVVRATQPGSAFASVNSIQRPVLLESAVQSIGLTKDVQANTESNFAVKEYP